MVLIGLIIIAVVLMALMVRGVLGIRLKLPAPMPAEGPDRAGPGYRSGEIVSTFTSRDVEAADELALARLDDDGAPSAVTWPQHSDSHGHHAIRQGHT
jgi:hypothetical protein